MHSDVERWTKSRFPASHGESLSVRPMLAYRNEVAAVGRHTAAAHPFYTFWWIEEGRVRVQTQSGVVEVMTGEWIFIPYGLWREQRFPEGTRIISINFQAYWREHLPIIRGASPITGNAKTLPGLFERAAAVTAPLRGAPGEADWHLTALPPGPRMELVGALFQFANHLFTHVLERGATLTGFPASDARIERVLHDLHRQLRAGPLPFARWQEQTLLGRTQLERLAKEQLRCSLREYRDELLTTAVCRALTTERPLVKQVAERFGFVDTAHLCRWLKARTGRSPAEFRDTAVV